MSRVRHSEITLHRDPTVWLIYKPLLRKGQPLRNTHDYSGCFAAFEPNEAGNEEFFPQC